MVALVRILALGAILSAVSEIWFYPVTFGPHLAELVAYYGIFGYAAWLVLAHFGAKGLAAGYLAACLFGFLAESVTVPVLFQGLPLSIVWTSLAWHAVITALLGLWMFRRIIARSSLGIQVIFCAAFGAYLGLSTVELWTVPEDGAPWVWPDIMTVWTQFLTGWAIFVAGHLLLNRTARYTVRPARWSLPAFGLVVAFLFALQNALTWFPASLILPVLVIVTVGPIWRNRQEGPSPVLVQLVQSTVPITGVMVSLLIPLSATLAQGALALWDIRLEGSAFHILWAGPVSVGLLFWALARTWRSPSARM